MDNIYIFKTRFIEEWKRDIRNNKKIDYYLGDNFVFTPEDVFCCRDLKIEKMPELLIPEKNNTHDVENAISLFEGLKTLTQVQASDVRFWTFLAHVNYWNYMKNRYPIDNRPKEKQSSYIISHWFLDPLNAANLTRRHGIASLWWGAYRTYDATKKDPYELTKELFSMLDYSTHLTSGTQGRNPEFFLAVLEFVVKNPKLFAKNKEARVRYIMRTMNRRGGYKIFAGLSRNDIIQELSTLKNDIEKITDPKIS